MNYNDPNFKQQVQRLHQLTVYSRWSFVMVCWLILAPLGIWGLRHEIALWREYFTWTAVRYGLAYNLLPMLCLAFCLATTTSVLLWQSRNILIGMPLKERQHLEKQVQKIQATGPRHPLWRWVMQSPKNFN